MWTFRVCVCVCVCVCVWYGDVIVVEWCVYGSCDVVVLVLVVCVCLWW